MSIQNNSIINLDDQGDEEDEEVNAEDYSHESSLLPSNKKKSFRTGRKFSNIWKYFKAGNQVGLNNDIRKAILGEFVKEYGDVPSNESDDDTEIERTNIKRPRLDNTLDSFFNNVEVAKINLRVEGELERSKNLTLNEISSDVVKKILQRRGFFDDMEALAQILKPIRTAIQELETTSITLADCYIHLIKIAAAFKGLPLEDYRSFRNCCMFMDDTYLLSFYLHPQYKGIGVNKKYFPKILTHAANIWRDLGHKQESCKELLDVSIELSTENDDELQLTDDIQLELEQLLSISQVVVVINNENIDEHCQEEVTSDSTNNEEDYDPAELASGYLSDFE
ncbi:5822_t:CDS:2 [Entrophospora sp. SA101]|nr:5822_t:CDS:2 [Entrophospora sp. SA101]